MASNTVDLQYNQAGLALALAARSRRSPILCFACVNRRGRLGLCNT